MCFSSSRAVFFFLLVSFRGSCKGGGGLRGASIVTWLHIPTLQPISPQGASVSRSPNYFHHWCHVWSTMSKVPIGPGLDYRFIGILPTRSQTGRGPLVTLLTVLHSFLEPTDGKSINLKEKMQKNAILKRLSLQWRRCIECEKWWMLFILTLVQICFVNYFLLTHCALANTECMDHVSFDVINFCN